MRKLDAVTGVTIAILVLVAVVFMAVLFAPGFTADQRTMVITAAVAALGTSCGYWLGSTAEQAKRNAPPPAPSTTTTIVKTDVPTTAPSD